MDQYQTYIAMSRYAKYMDDQKRRESWKETVDRYVDFVLAPKIDSNITNEIRQAIFNMDIVPSMRAMMTSGASAERDNTCIYNCSYLPVDSPRSFDEAMFILLCGTGVGFSVESQYIDKLPDVPTLNNNATCIIVEDSKEGWATALRTLIDNLYNGAICSWDVSQVRPAGARLKTFGGRSSGPEPLVDLFNYTISAFTNAQGRKLTTLECHDIMCKIGEVVVVGGIRRSALISLSDLNDTNMRTAKSGSWWEKTGFRALANNSAVYEKKPSVGTFLEEWTSLYNSHSGERGIFNREAARATVAKHGNRDVNHEFGTNPCCEIILRPFQFCNLSEVIIRHDDTVETIAQKIRYATIVGTIQSTFTHFPYLRDIWRQNTVEERLLGVSLTGIYDNKIMSTLGFDLESTLDYFRNVARRENIKWANILNISVSTAITCVKPSGTVSQLTNSASGIHPRHSPYYIRRVRGDSKDPLSQFLIDQGVPYEKCLYKPNQTLVFSFPQKAPGIITRGDVSPIDHLKMWKTYQQNWCEHKPSVTISVGENDWPRVGAWVWENFDDISGISFLPYDGGSYKQAPYEECTEDEYNQALNSMPIIKWDQFFEDTDNTESTMTLACVGGACDK